MIIKRIVATLTLITILTFAAVAQGPAESKTSIFVSKEALDASVKAVPCETDARLDGVKKLFTAAGATEADLKVEKLDKDKISNVVVAKKGETDETVVIGAHYDRTNSGCGVTDNWTGVTIIAHIYQTLRPLNTKKSYVFVAFDKEEEGLRGSSQMLKAMAPEQTEKICSMINFDSFGQGQPMALKNASSPKMLKLAEDLGKEAGFKFNSIEITGASSDSASFRDKKIPAITLSGLSGNWTDILHSSSDKLSNVNIDSVYFGYRFGLIFLSKIDAGGCRDFR
jgi:Zn-dependent M28 family amino/carboxypeptidase